jgi:lipopolysaccharide transport system permease protein
MNHTTDSALAEEILIEITSHGKPRIRITPKKRWWDLDLSEIRRRPGLLWLLVLKSVRLKYRQTILGVLWTVIQPLAPMLIFSFVFYGYFSKDIGELTYPIFVYAGLIPWMYFSNATSQTGDSLASHSHLLGKIYFPRFMLPLSVVIALGLDFAIGCLMLAVVMIFSGTSLHPTVLLIPFLFLVIAWLALAVGTFFASMTVIYRDLRNILPYSLQMLLFLTPIVYPIEAIPERWRWLIKLNPLTAIIGSFRSVLQGDLPVWNELFYSVAMIALISFLSMLIFVKMEKHVADYL